MDRPIFSIIVPVYKVEKYLGTCLNSITRQTFTNYEVILVDDGSPDDCPKICEEFKKHETRCKVIHQKNKGLSGARNAGLKIARGKYIYFLDSDDTISDDLLINLYITFETYKVDIVGFDATVFEQGKTYCLSTGGFTGRNEKGIDIAKKKTPLSTVPLYSYRKSFLYKHDLFFLENIYYEDVLFTAQVFLKNPEIYYLGKTYYFYNKREESITTSHVKSKNYKDIVNICKHLIGDGVKGEKCAEDAYKNIIRSYILLSEEIYRKMNNVDKFECRFIRNSLIKLIKDNKGNLGLINYIIVSFLNTFYMIRNVRRKLHGNS